MHKKQILFSLSFIQACDHY